MAGGYLSQTPFGEKAGHRYGFPGELCNHNICGYIHNHDLQL